MVALNFFLDIEKETYVTNWKDFYTAYTYEKAIPLPVHLMGKPAKMDVIMQIAKKHKLIVVEDAAEAHGTLYKGFKAGINRGNYSGDRRQNWAPPVQVRTDLQSMINSEMITDFHIDYGADQVVSTKFIPKTSHKTVVKCSACGGNNELIVGVTRNCAYCEQPLQMRSKGAE
jgi:hypothetical protein